MLKKLSDLFRLNKIPKAESVSQSVNRRHGREQKPHRKTNFRDKGRDHVYRNKFAHGHQGRGGFQDVCRGEVPLHLVDEHEAEIMIWGKH